MNVNPGEMNKKISIYNADDQLVIQDKWAKVRKISGTEMVKNNVQFEQATTRFVIRYTSTPISSDYTVSYGGYRYDIQYTNDYNESHEYIEIIAIKRAYQEVEA